MHRLARLIGTFAVAALAILYCSGTVAQSQELSIEYKWKNVKINAGGYITGIIFSPNFKDELYVRTDIGGAYRRDETGIWQPLFDGLSREDWNLNGILSIAIDTRDPNKVYFAAGTYTSGNSSNGAIFRSNNKGKTWSKTILPFKLGANENGRGSGERLIIDSKNNNRLWLGSTKDGLWRSDDGAISWSQIAFRNQHVLFVISKRNGDLLVSTQSGLFESYDNGQSFTQIKGLPNGLFAINGSELNGGDVVLTLADNIGPNDIKNGAVIRYTANKQIIDESPIIQKTETFGYGGISANDNAKLMLVSTNNKWAKGDEIFLKKGEGNWTSLNKKSAFDLSNAPWLLEYSKGNFEHIGHWISDLEIDPFDENHAIYVTGYGLWETHNLNAEIINWKFSNIGIEETAILDLAAPKQITPNQQNPILISAIGDISGFMHFDLDDNKKSKMLLPFTGNSRSVDASQIDPKIMTRTIDKSPYGFITLDNGQNWRGFTHFNSQAKANGGVIRLSADSKTLAWLIDGECFHSMDLGTSWAKCAGIDKKINNGILVADRVDSAIFYIYDIPTGHIYRSNDGAKSFTKTPNNLPPWTNSLASVPENPNHIWAATTEGVKASDNGGETFIKIEPFDASWAIAFGKPEAGESYPNIFVAGKIGSLSGIFMSPNLGEKWLLISNSNQQFSSLRMMQGDPNIFGRLYVGTDGRGIFYGDISIANKARSK